MASLLLLNGPNLNLLGSREPGLYGDKTLAEIEDRLVARATAAGHNLECLQSNAEHVLIDRIHAAGDIDMILFNPGAFTHTSIALRDALLGVAVPFIEVHLSNIFAREAFRHRSMFSDIAAGCIFGLGPSGYDLALDAALRRLEQD